MESAKCDPCLSRPSLPTPTSLLKVSIIIPSRDRIELLRTCITSLLSLTKYPNFDILIVDNESQEDKTRKQYDLWRSHEKMRFLQEPGSFNFSRLNNMAAASTDSPLLLLLNNDTEIIQSDWLTRLVSLMDDPSVGAVAPTLLYRDGTLQHVGVVQGMLELAGHPFKGLPPDVVDPTRMIHTLRPCSAVTAACMLTRRSVYLEVGGFEESLPTSYNDVDYSLKLVSRDYRILFDPETILIHEESQSRATPRSNIHQYQSDIAFMKARWHWRLKHDSFYHPSRSLRHADCRIID